MVTGDWRLGTGDLAGMPPSLDRLRGVPGGPEWLEALPARVAECAARWGLEVGEPFPGSYVSVVLPVVGAGIDAVLKLQFPHDESEHEAEALRAWGGEGAVRLIDHDPEGHALLLERCRPGTHLAAAGPDIALDVLVRLIPRLSIPAGAPFTAVDDEARGWIDDIPALWQTAGRPFEERLVTAAVEGLQSVIGTGAGSVLLHQDLHGDNVLRAEREPWLVIDPKPLAGDPAFAVAPIVRSYELGHDRAAVVRRFDRLTGDLDLDRDRARAWTVGQTVAWAFEGGGVIDRHVDTARWVLDPT